MHYFNKTYLPIAARLIALLLILTFSVAIILAPGTGRAQAGMPFGGMVTSVIYCSCSGNYRLDVSPPVGGTFMYQPGATIVYEYYQIPVAGVWLLGLYGGPVACLVPSGKGCASLGAYPVIEMTGTSM